MATTSRRTPRCSAASAENVRAIVPNASQSVRASHGGGTAWLNECTNGCMSVIDRSYFSYQVAAGSTTSEYRPGRRHAEVDVDQQVELAARDLLAPAHARRALVRRQRLGQRPVVDGAEQVAQEVLLALARGAEQVRAPDEEHAREARRRARVVDREAQAARLELGHDVLGRVDAGGRRPRRRARAGCGRTSGTTASSPSAPPWRARRSPSCPANRPAPERRREALRAAAGHSATARCAW